MIKILATAACGLLVTGCVSLSRSSPVTSMTNGEAAGMRVAEITLSVDPLVKVSPQFDAIFREHVKAKLDACATGAKPVKLAATIERLDKSNAVMVAIVAGANVVRGSATLLDPASGKMLAQYKVGQTIVGRSVAVIVMAKAEEQLSDGYGDELCQQAFPPLPKDGAPKK